MSNHPKPEAREILAEKLKVVVSYVGFNEQRLEHLATEMTKLALEVPPAGIDRLLDEINRILDEVYIAGPSRSLIQGDLDSLEARLGPEFAQRKQARIVRLVAARQAVIEGRRGEDVRLWRAALGDMLAAFIELLETAIEPAGLLRGEIIQKLEQPGTALEPIARNEFRREGEVWLLAFNLEKQRFKDCTRSRP